MAGAQYKRFRDGQDEDDIHQLRYYDIYRSRPGPTAQQNFSYRSNKMSPVVEDTKSILKFLKIIFDASCHRSAGLHNRTNVVIFVVPGLPRPTHGSA